MDGLVQSADSSSSVLCLSLVLQTANEHDRNKLADTYTNCFGANAHQPSRSVNSKVLFQLARDASRLLCERLVIGIRV